MSESAGREPFDLGLQQGYRDQVDDRVTYDEVDRFTSVPPEWAGDDEYYEGYTEGVDNAKTDRQNRLGGPHP